MKKKIVSGLMIASLLMLNSCSLFRKDEAEPTGPINPVPQYSLIDAGYDTPVRAQNFEDGWAMATVNAMESELWMRTGEHVELTPGILVNTVYASEQSGVNEGYYSSNALNARCIPVWITSSLATRGMEGYFLTESNDYTSLDRLEIQQKLRDGGALTTFFRGIDRWRFKSINGHMTYNAPDVHDFLQLDQIITIVGYDDNFPAENFFPVASGNGAWLVQNTRGQYWGDENGYFWISYDTELFSVCDYVLSDEYTDVLSYESGVSCLISTGDITETANVFHRRGTIGAVGTYTSEPNEEITVEIYNGEFGELLYTGHHTFDYVGYHTVALDEPVNITSGTFTVVVRYPAGAPVEGECYQSTTTDGIMRGFYAECEEGQSFVRINGSWVDLTTRGISNMVEMISDGESWAADRGLGLQGRRSGAPNNACIKVLFV